MGVGCSPAALGDVEACQSLVVTIALLCFGCCIPLPHPPPVAQEPREFLSYGLGFQKAQEVQEVSKMLEKGMVEIVQEKELVFHSKWFLVKASGRWRPTHHIGTCESSNSLGTRCKALNCQRSLRWILQTYSRFSYS